MIAAKPPYTSTSGQVPQTHLVARMLEEPGMARTLCGLTFHTRHDLPGSMWDEVGPEALAIMRSRDRVCARCLRTEAAERHP